MTNPLDEALQTKEAFLGRAVRGLRSLAGRAGPSLMEGVARAGPELGRHATIGAATAAGGLGVAGIAEGAKKLMGAANKRRDFRDMMEADPGLQELQDSDPGSFNRSYTSLRRLNPTFAKDPIVAGSIVRRMVENPAGAANILMSTVKTPSPAQPSPFFVDASMGPVRYQSSL